MPLDEKIAVTVMMVILGIGLLFVGGSGRWKYHEINPFRILLARRDGTLRPLAKPLVWGALAIATACVWLLAETQ